MSPNLARIGEKAKAHHKLVFTSLYHHIADIEHLRAWSTSGSLTRCATLANKR